MSYSDKRNMPAKSAGFKANYNRQQVTGFRLLRPAMMGAGR
jgi:hypothetical protein